MQCLRCPGKGFLGLYSGGWVTLKGSRHMERANSMGDASKWQWRREGNLTERFPGKRNSRKSCKETQLCQHGEEGEDSEKGITWGFTIGKYSMPSHLSFEHLLMVCYPHSLHVLRGSLMLSCVPLLQAVLLAPSSGQHPRAIDCSSLPSLLLQIDSSAPALRAVGPQMALFSTIHPCPGNLWAPWSSCSLSLSISTESTLLLQ